MTRRIRSMVTWMSIVALTVGFGAISVLAQSDAGQQVFAVDGIEAPIVAREIVSDIEPGSILLFERIELPPSWAMPARTAVSPELYYVQAGEFSIRDDFGFGTTIPAGDGLTLKAGTAYTAGNDGSEAATVLRLRVAKAADASDDQATEEATPVGQAGGGVSVLVELPLEETLADANQMFIARATLSPGAATGEQVHAGPIGVYVESGTLSIASPSGFQGTIGAEQGVVLPADMPLQASAEDVDVVMLLVGIGPVEGPFAEVAEEPEPTPVPTSQATVAAAAQASPVAVGATPVGTPDATSDTGVFLQMGETWQVESASLRLQVGDYSSRDGIRIKFTYHNLSDSRVDFTIPNGYVDVHDDLRNPWKPVAGGSYTGVRVILDPDDSFEGGWWWKPENVDLDKHSANVFVTFRNFGDITVAKWGFTVATGRILTIPPDAIDPAASHVGLNSVGTSSELGIDS